MLSRARDYPYEIFQTPQRILVNWEPLETTRNIRLDLNDFPEDLPPHRQGFSIAHWEADELVIETRALTGTNSITERQRSDQAQIHERWKRIQHSKYGDVIEITMTVVDPVIYQTPATGQSLLKRAPAGTFVGGYNCTEALWDNYVDEHLNDIGIK